MPALEPGKTYLVELVLRTMTLGHIFTQGTADSKRKSGSDISAYTDDRNCRSQWRDGFGRAGRCDPWSHFVNALRDRPAG